MEEPKEQNQNGEMYEAIDEYKKEKRKKHKKEKSKSKKKHRRRDSDEVELETKERPPKGETEGIVASHSNISRQEKWKEKLKDKESSSKKGYAVDWSTKEEGLKERIRQMLGKN